MIRSETHKAAQYFYNEFMGCSILPNCKKLTLDFYNHTNEFINQSPSSENDKLGFNYALYTYLKVSQNNYVEIGDFADSFLPSDIRDDYRSFMEEKGFPQTAVLKDLSYLKNILRYRTIRFTTNVKISAPSQDFDHIVSIVDNDQEATTLKIQGKILCHN